jgi:hypothetical protein
MALSASCERMATHCLFLKSQLSQHKVKQETSKRGLPALPNVYYWASKTLVT